jgi:ribonuclease VapC
VIVDASALVAIVHQEDDARIYLDAIEAADRVAVSAASLFEATLKVDPGGVSVARALDEVIRGAGMEIIPFEAEHAEVAREARRIYGKGTGNRANLNFGDCMTYATAYIADEPLLYKGNDFAHTDLKSALD